ncbi:hypothetical protein CTZ27_35215 [Streptomyces griseocarneus]|nr:hypothetical protein CTZ27_35215 [Streptomyces griseocarneus]
MQLQPAKGSRVQNDHERSRPPAAESGSDTAPEERSRDRRLFQVGNYLVETNPHREVVMLTPGPVPPVVSLLLSSTIGSIHYVDCTTCVSLLRARSRHRERGDETRVQEINDDLAAHCAKRHMRARGW